jgi:polyadenylation factor subunit 2
MFESRPFQRRPRGPAQQDADFAPLKRSRGQRPVDYYSSAIRYLQMAPYVHPSVSMVVPPHDYYAKDVLPPLATPFNMSTAICTQWAHTAHYPDTQRNLERGFPRRRNIFTNAVWAPSGRKLLCTVSNGEFIVFNGQSFGVEHKTTAHEDGRMCRAAAWSGLTDAVLTGDDAGIVKLWGSNLQVAAEFDCNQRSIRAVEWAPSEKRFCTAGQDGSVRIWDTERVAASAAGTAPEVESKLEGHGGDVICVKWHPTKALLATGSQDKCCRLWDPRAGVDNQLAVLQGHSEPVTSIGWNPCGNEWQLLSAGRDSMVRLWDARMLQQLCVFAGHTADVNGVAWHPTVPNLFASVGADGLLAYWNADAATPATNGTNTTAEVSKWAGAVTSAHDQVREKPNPISGLAWSPLGHVLATFSLEVNIWTRNKPGAVEEIRYQNEDAADVIIGAAGGADSLLAWA